MPPDHDHHTREPHQPTSAVVVDGEFGVNGITYQVKLDRIGPGNVEFRLIIDERTRGLMPFDNLVKAATRIDPDHAVGSEKQIRELREQAAKARGEMYDQQARADQAEAKVALLEVELQKLKTELQKLKTDAAH